MSRKETKVARVGQTMDADEVRDHCDTSRRSLRLNLQFAALSCMGGLILGNNAETEWLPLIAVFFAIFGFVVVDWLKMFSLPAVAAYIAMGGALLYCVTAFSDFTSPGSQQMTAVATLLVIVQAVLILQRKTIRIYEQLGVFCLLELVVAAVFNDALKYGLLFVPIMIVGCWCLALLSVIAAETGTSEIDSGALAGSELIRSRQIRDTASSPGRSNVAFVRASRWISLYAFWTVGPAVVAVGVIFFYGLPRTADASRITGGGNALVGFSDEVRLGQIGEMQQSSEISLRVGLTDAGSRQEYLAHGGIYLRGKVLEHYNSRTTSEQAAGSWSSIKPLLPSGAALPRQFQPSKKVDRNFYDTVKVAVSSESNRSRALFAVGPYFRTQRSREVVHLPSRGTLMRRDKELPRFGFEHPRLTYEFGTHAFDQGMQTELVAKTDGNQFPARNQSADRIVSFTDTFNSLRQVADANYRTELLSFDATAIPTARRLADLAMTGMQPASRKSYLVAKRLEQFFARENGFAYTLDLSAPTVEGVDPIEQFLANDRRGNCQYFASALAMMLRSQSIPARLVVGYHTDEYNHLNHHFVARQLHAHAWVEALIPREDLPPGLTVYGQPEAGEYWLRLDATPSDGTNVSAEIGAIDQTLDVFQNLWDEYVVEMDAARQQNVLDQSGGSSAIGSSYSLMVARLALMLDNLRAGKLGGGSLSGKLLFSWPAALFGVVLTLFVFLCSRMRIPTWVRRSISSGASRRALKPSIPFYVDALVQLRRLGITPRAGQTPREFVDSADSQFPVEHRSLFRRPLNVVVDRLYQTRYRVAPDKTQLILDAQAAVAELKSLVDAALKRG